MHSRAVGTAYLQHEMKALPLLTLTPTYSFKGFARVSQSADGIENARLSS